MLKFTRIYQWDQHEGTEDRIDEDGETHLYVDPAEPGLVLLHSSPGHVPVLPHPGDVDVLEGVSEPLQPGALPPEGGSGGELDEEDSQSVGGHNEPEEAEVLAQTEACVPGVAGRAVICPVPAVQLCPEDGGGVVQLQHIGGPHRPRLADSEGDLLCSPVVEETEQTEGRGEETHQDGDSLAGGDGGPGQHRQAGGEWIEMFVHLHCLHLLHQEQRQIQPDKQLPPKG